MNRVFGMDGYLVADGEFFIYRGYVVYYAALKAAGTTSWPEPASTGLAMACHGARASSFARAAAVDAFVFALRRSAVRG